MSSKFSGLLSQARNRTSEELEVESPETDTTTSRPVAVAPPPQTEVREAPLNTGGQTAPSRPSKTKEQKPSQPVPSSTLNSEPEALQSNRGRPRTGKRSDPNYTQITAYIHKSTHRDVKVALAQENEGREISEVIEDCLADWLSRRK